MAEMLILTCGLKKNITSPSGFRMEHPSQKTFQNGTLNAGFC